MSTQSLSPSRSVRSRLCYAVGAVLLVTGLVASVPGAAQAATQPGVGVSQGKSLAATGTGSGKGAKSSTTTTTTKPLAAGITVEDGSNVPGDGQLRGGYLSLSASLINYYAKATGQPLSSYVSNHAGEVADVLGVGLSGRATTLDALNLQIANEHIVGVGTGDFSSMLAELNKNTTPDSVMVASGMDFAKTLGGLTTPALTSPSVPNVSGADSDGLVFGLFANQSLSQLVTNAPDVFGEVSKAGLTSPSAFAAWDQAKLAAGASINQSLGASLPNQCSAAMVTAMASGSASGARAVAPSGCDSCITAGVYLSGSMSRLLEPGGGSTLQTSDGTTSVSEWNSLSGWQKDAIKGANPGLSGQLGKSLSTQKASNTASASCASSSAGTTNFLTGNLSGILSQLGG